MRTAPRGFVRGVAVLAGGTALGQLVAAASAPALTRLYSPADLGIFALYFTYVSFVQTGTSLMYDSAIPLAGTQPQAARLLVIAAVAAVPTSVLGGAVGLLLVRLGVFGYGALPAWIALLLVVALLVTSTFTTLRYWLVRQAEFGGLARALFVQNAGRTAGQVGAGLAGVGWIGLVLSDVAGRALGVGRNLLDVAADVRNAGPVLDRPTVVATMRLFRKFPLLYLPSTMVNNLVAWLPLPIVVMAYGTSAGGYYAIVVRVVSVPLTLVGSSVADVFHNRVARAARAGEDAVRLLLRAVLGLLAIGALPALALLAAGPELFGVVLGEKWRAAGQLAAVLVPGFLAQFCVSPVSRVVIVFDAQRSKLVFDLLALAATAGAGVAAVRGDLTLLGFGVVLSAANVLLYGVYLLLLVQVVRARRTGGTAGSAAVGGGPTSPR